MEYRAGNFKVKIDRNSHYTVLKMYHWDQGDFRLFYKNEHLPVCESKIEAEDNAERIANLHIKLIEEGRI